MRSALIPGLGTVRHGLVGKDKRCMGEFALVNILSSFLACFRGFNIGARASAQGDRKAFACLDVAPFRCSLN